MVQRVSAKLHGAGNNGLCGQSVEHRFVFEYDETRHVRDNTSLLELFHIIYLDIWEPQRLDKVCAAHNRSVVIPLRRRFIDK